MVSVHGWSGGGVVSEPCRVSEKLGGRGCGGRGCPREAATVGWTSQVWRWVSQGGGWEGVSRRRYKAPPHPHLGIQYPARPRPLHTHPPSLLLHPHPPHLTHLTFDRKVTWIWTLLLTLPHTTVTPTDAAGYLSLPIPVTRP